MKVYGAMALLKSQELLVRSVEVVAETDATYIIPDSTIFEGRTEILKKYGHETPAQAVAALKEYLQEQIAQGTQFLAVIAKWEENHK